MKSHQKVRLFSDCKSFVTVAASLMAARLEGRQIPLPKANRDLWACFCESLDGFDLACSSVTWIRSHRNYLQLQGTDRVTAWFNHWADRAADQVVQSLSLDPLYEDFSGGYLRSLQQARDLASFQAGTGFIFGNDELDAPVDRPPIVIEQLIPEGIPATVSVDSAVSVALPSQRFCDVLAKWLVSFSFVCDTSWVELFWYFLADVGVLPPFRRFGEWVWAQDASSLLFVLPPPVLVLFRPWKLHLNLLLSGGRLSLFWGGLVSKAASLGTLGARFSAGGFVGRGHASVGSGQLCAAPRLLVLRLPASVN